ncbi:MAG TPA: DUF937 domain-containing protein [Geminicoccaceae bacterium]|nr:DUF937 domain-containing protein [Geminicoccaceae bacterium]
MKLFDTIREAGGGRIVAALAAKAGIGPDAAEEALRALLPEIGHAIRRMEESGSGAAVVSAAMHDERYARYLERPEALAEPAAVDDGEAVLADVLDDDERSDLIRRVAAEIGPDESEVRDLLPLVAALAMAALGQKLHGSSPGLPWFGSRPGDRLDAPLLNALTALFEQDDEGPKDR